LKNDCLAFSAEPWILYQFFSSDQLSAFFFCRSLRFAFASRRVQHSHRL